jgi:hypothetical protein
MAIWARLPLLDRCLFAAHHEPLNVPFGQAPDRLRKKDARAGFKVTICDLERANSRNRSGVGGGWAGRTLDLEIAICDFKIDGQRSRNRRREPADRNVMRSGKLAEGR